MPDPRLVPCTRSRISTQDYDAVFTAGGCFIFALRLHERFGWKIRGMRRPAHVWAIKDGKGVDVRGMFDEQLLAELANGGVQAPIEDFTADDLRTEIAKKEYPPELLVELCALADRIFDTHERYVMARPPNPEAVALFAGRD